MIEAESRPYRFDIDKMLSIESKSPAQSFRIEPYRNQIENRLKKEITVWNDKKGPQYKQAGDYEIQLIKELEKLQPNIIQEVGSSAMHNSKPTWYFIPEELKFEITFVQFQGFKIDVPLNEIEAFKNNFSKMQYRNEVILFNESDQFVFSEVEVFNPTTNTSYFYKLSAAENIPSPTFTISLPEEEF